MWLLLDKGATLINLQAFDKIRIMQMSNGKHQIVGIGKERTVLGTYETQAEAEEILLKYRDRLNGLKSR